MPVHGFYSIEAMPTRKAERSAVAETEVTGSDVDIKRCTSTVIGKAT